jgi:hypothetical protein
MRLSPRLVAFGVTLVFGTAASAATVTSEQGEILVNSGSGFRAIKQTLEVSAGDQVMAKPKSAGRVVYAEGCVVRVSPGMVLTIAPNPPCTRTAQHIETQASMPPSGPPQGQNSGSDALFLGVVAVPTGMVLLSANKDKAASP